VLTPSYSFTWQLNEGAVDGLLDSASDAQRASLLGMRDCLRELGAEIGGVKTTHTLGGGGYTHSIPNYGRVVREGLSEHQRRVEGGLRRSRETGDAERIDFYLALGDVLAGIRAWHERVLAYLREQMEAGAEPHQNI